MDYSNGNVEEDRVSLVTTLSTHPAPDTVTKLIKRLRAMTLKLLPVQVETTTLVDPTSRVITPKVITAYSKAAGDFQDVLPYALLRARQSFMWDANANPSDYDENLARAVACEVLARRIVHSMPEERIYAVMSGRFRFQEWNGDESALTSALETAIDQHWGDWIQQENEHNDIDYIPYRPQPHSFLDHLDPSRLSVPRYQNWFRIILWLFFLLAYSQAVKQPTEMTMDPRHPFDKWEIILYGMALAYSFEDIDKIYATLRFFTWRAFSFWLVVSVITDSLLITAFTLRIVGIALADEDAAAGFKLQSFQVLSCVAPLICTLLMKDELLTTAASELITVFDGFKYIGTMQICVARMLRESGIFFVLLAIVGVGFAQSMYAIDAADGYTDRGSLIINNLIQGLLGSPDFSSASNAWALWIYYFWNVFTTILLLNILISLFSSAYDDVTDDAAAHFLAFFASKTVSMIRAPDKYVYPAPFNLIETFLVAPLEWFMSKKRYAKYNRIVMTTVFLIPLAVIALVESQLDVRANLIIQNLYDHVDEGEEEDPKNQDPETTHEDGLEISRVSFSDLVKEFPNSYQSMESSILAEIDGLKRQITELSEKLDKK
ncbi:hypothetical protein FRC04_003968 [Tulasnella sp. 424]|nr:hypothetical protein FRC04_003968 [Tulasnella sp. 424]